MEWVQKLSSFPSSGQQGTVLGVSITGKNGKAGGGGLDIVMEPPICQTLYVTLLKYLRAATFENQFSVIFNSTPKITKHREYNIWTSLVSN